MNPRPATNEDANAICRLVEACFLEYEGCVIDVEGEERDLQTPADSFDRFWVMEKDGRIVGTVACADKGRGVVELKRMYLAKHLRGSGRADTLLALVEDRARELGATRIEMWSDTRFTRAHGFYARAGYEMTGRTRELNDISNTTEYHLEKTLET
jgi:putative acetyltransferase